MSDAIDQLTGLLTVQAFMHQLNEIPLDDTHRVLIIMDLDHLKSLNDRYGHQAGDAWILAAAQRFAESFSGEGCLVGRYGGDEFTALVTTPDLLAMYEKAEALRLGVENDGPALPHDEPVPPSYTISLGLAAYPANAGDLNELVEKGKEALLRAKIAGGNRVSFYKETDTLTGLLNDYAAQRGLDEALKTAIQNKDVLSVFVMDIDRFSEINVQYGHRTGDEVLKRLAHILESNFKEVGLTARVSGDQYMVILPGQRADSAFILAEEVRRLVEDSEVKVQLSSANSPASTYTVRMHISGGIASFPADATERVDLLRKADEALYRSKKTGRNRISLPTSAQMVTKTSYYTQVQLERLAGLARQLDKTEAFLLREALDDLLNKYKERAGGM